MPRLPRLHVPGAFYLATLRGNHQRNIFFNAQDRLLLEEFVADALRLTRTRLHAYCWLPNQIQMLAQISDLPLGQFMQRIGTRYARAVQNKLLTNGHLFAGRYESVLVDANDYLLPLLREIHWSPVRAGIVSNPEKHRWSSHRDYLGTRSRPWLDIDFGLGMLHHDRDRAHALYAAFVSSPEYALDERAMQNGRLADPRVLGGKDFMSSLATTAPPEIPATTLELIARELCRDYDVTREQLRSAHQTRSLSRVRGLITARALQLRVATLAQIGRFLNRSASALARAAQRYDR